MRCYLLGLLFVVALTMVSAMPFELEPPIDVEDQCDIDQSSHGASSTDCQVYYICPSPGVIIGARCEGETIWTPITANCEHPEDAVNDVCGWKPIDTVSGRPRHPRFRPGFQCADGSKMIPFSSRCDGKKNCPDGSDEEGGCGHQRCSDCKNPTCNCQERPRCANGSTEEDCAEPCDPEKCKLPHCRCPSIYPPTFAP